jgi:hypothetical protein
MVAKEEEVCLPDHCSSFAAVDQPAAGQQNAERLRTRYRFVVSNVVQLRTTSITGNLYRRNSRNVFRLQKVVNKLRFLKQIKETKK